MKLMQEIDKVQKNSPPKIELSEASLTYPITTTLNRSIRADFANKLVGGKFKRYGRKQYIQALENITLTIQAGDKIGLIGHNGAGKSTLLRMLAGIYEPTTGNIQINGKTTALLDMGTGVDAEATGLENITLRSLYMGYTKKEIKTKIDEIVEFSDLGNYIHMPMKIYSSGMRSRLMFAITTAFDCDILLLDEGIIAGDKTFQKKAKEKLNGFLSGKDVTLILASHSNAFLSQYCDKGLVLENGNIAHQGTIEACFNYYDK